MKRIILVAFLLAVTLSLVWSSVASAAFCYVADKPDGAGNFGDVLIDTSTTPWTVTMPTNPGGQVAGGFVTVYMDGNLVVEDTFLLPSNPALGEPPAPTELPDGAHAAAGPDHGVNDVNED